MSIFSFMRSGFTAPSPVAQTRRPGRASRNRSRVCATADILRRASLEALEGRRLLTVTVVDQNADNTGPTAEFSDQFFGPFISADSRYIAFDSMAGDLIVNTPGLLPQQVYIRDRILKTTRLVTLDQFNRPAQGFSYVAGMSGNGQYVLFFSDADGLVGNDTNGVMDLFRANILTGAIDVVSVDSGGNPVGVTVDGDLLPAFPAYISTDGNFVSFVTNVDGVPDAADNKQNTSRVDDANGADDIFVRNMTTGRNFLATPSITKDPAQQNTIITSPTPGIIESYAMSADGAFIAFASDTPDLVANDNPDGTVDVFRRAVLAGTTTAITVDQGTFLGASSHVSISGDGSTVAFLTTDSSVYVTGAGTPQFMYWRGGNVNPASFGPAGADPDGVAYGYATLSNDGNFIFFHSDSTNLNATPTLGGINVFRHDVANNLTEVVSFGSSGASSEIFGFDQPYAGGVTPSGAGNASRISITADGRYATWADDSTLTDPTIVTYPPGATHIYVRDMLAPKPQLLDTVPGSTTVAADGTSTAPIIAQDARFVAFTSIGGTTIVGNDPDQHVYLADVPLFSNPGGTGSQQPTATLIASSVTNAGNTSYEFSVTYRGPRPIVIASLDAGDVTVSGIPGANLFLVGVNSATDANIVTATYRIIPPGGSWDRGDNKTYTVTLNRRQVEDQSGFQFPQVPLVIGSFTVNIPTIPPVGPTVTASVSESAGTYTLHITRNDNSTDVPLASVSYKITPGSATAAEDFNVLSPSSSLSGVLTNIPVGGSADIVFQIINDTMIEGPETFEVTLGGATFGATFSFNRAVITILDDDSPPDNGSGSVNVFLPTPSVPGESITVADGLPLISVHEADTIINIPVSRAGTGTSSSPATLTYTILSTPSNNAIPNQNFVPVESGTLNFAAGVDSQNIPVHILHDFQVTGDRTFTVVVSSSTTGLVLAGTSFQVQVLDVDSALVFANAALTFTDNSGIVALPINRFGNLTAGSKVTVNFSGTAIAGVDYEIVNEDNVLGAGNVVTFNPGEYVKTLHVKILNRTENNNATRNLALSLFGQSAIQPGDGITYYTVLGEPQTETISIVDVDAAGPQVTRVDLRTSGDRITAIVVKFDEKITPASAKRLANYVLFDRNPEPASGRLGQIIKFSSASYNAKNHVVVLTPESPLPAGTYQLNVNGGSEAAIKRAGDNKRAIKALGGILDLAGNPFDGNNNAAAGGTLIATIAYGRSIAYSDTDTDLVRFSLKGPGTLKFSRVNSSATLDVLGPSGESTTLIGSVAKRKPGNGRTTLDLVRLRGATFNPGPNFDIVDLRTDV